MGKHKSHPPRCSHLGLFISNVYLARYTRQGTPSPVQPDFSNLQSRWATISPSVVALSAYSAPPVSPRPCPASTEGGWAVDPSLALPTLGQVVTEAPGSTSSGPNPTAPHTSGSSMTSAPGDGAGDDGSGPATSTTARSSATQFPPSAVALIQGSVAGCVFGLLTLGLAGIFFL
jgi:1,3-beta-glucanosyltransferase GAS1